MTLHEIIKVKGCITQEKYIRGRTLPELERILGFHAGRLKKGVVVAALLRIPAKNQFELLGYTQVAEHKFDRDTLKGLDVDKLKDLVSQTAFTTVGTGRLVKILPNTPHSELIDNDTQYPVGLGVPQWKLTSTLNAQVVAIVTEGKRYG